MNSTACLLLSATRKYQKFKTIYDQIWIADDGTWAEKILFKYLEPHSVWQSLGSSASLSDPISSKNKYVILMHIYVKSRKMIQMNIFAEARIETQM